MKKYAYFIGVFCLSLVITFSQWPVLATAENQNLYNQDFLQQINKPISYNFPANNQVIVAVIDQGIDFTNPNLATNIWNGNNGIHGWNFVSNSPNINPLGSHGTEVAGIIKAVVGNTNVKFMSLVACDPKLGCTVNNLDEAIYYAADHNASIINLSLGLVGTNAFTKDFNQAIIYAYNKGVVITAAAGNGGQNLNIYPVSPLCNDNGQNMVLGVSSVNSANKPETWANYGACIDAWAPGDTLLSTTINSAGKSSYATVSGTSFSVAEVSGLAALIKLQSPTLSNRQIIDSINSSTNNGVIDITAALETASKLPTSVLSFQLNPLTKPFPASKPPHLPAIHPRGPSV